MDNWENEVFRWFELTEKLERAAQVINQYRDGIDHWRKQINYYNKLLGYLAGRRGDPEPRLPKEDS